MVQSLSTAIEGQEWKDGKFDASSESCGCICDFQVPIQCNRIGIDIDIDVQRRQCQSQRQSQRPHHWQPLNAAQRLTFRLYLMPPVRPQLSGNLQAQAAKVATGLPPHPQRSRHAASCAACPRRWYLQEPPSASPKAPGGSRSALHFIDRRGCMDT